MKFLFDLFPILLFFSVFKLAEIYEQLAYSLVARYLSGFISGGSIKPDQGPIILATVVAIIATVGQLLYVKLRGRKIDGMLWVSFLVITVFGSLTIYLHDDTFIKLKPTIIYWVFALALCIGHFGFRKNMMRQVMEQQIKLPEAVWDRVAWSWMAFFFSIGLINLFAAFVLFKDNTSAWVSFKLFGITGIMFVFIIAQTLFLAKHIEEEA
ncbi:MAG: septation protein A [Pseudomonadota bacterium]